VSAPSLRRRAAIVAAVVCAGVMALGGGAAWWWMRSTWLTTFEQAMHERANALGLQIELDDRDEVATGDPALTGRPRESYAIWDADGNLLHASEGIDGLGFQRQSQVGWQFTDHGTFRTVWVRVTLGWHEDDDHDAEEERDLKREQNNRIKERDEADKSGNKDDAEERDKKSDGDRVDDPNEHTGEKVDEREWVLVALGCERFIPFIDYVGVCFSWAFSVSRVARCRCIVVCIGSHVASGHHVSPYD